MRHLLILILTFNFNAGIEHLNYINLISSNREEKKDLEFACHRTWVCDFDSTVVFSNDPLTVCHHSNIVVERSHRKWNVTGLLYRSSQNQDKSSEWYGYGFRSVMCTPMNSITTGVPCVCTLFHHL